MRPIERIHHISATVGNPKENYIFYKNVLGLRLVKKTVNFEDKDTYHLYFANNQVDSGTIMTFFPLNNDLYGRVGGGQVRTIAFSVPKASINEWENQLNKYKVMYEKRRYEHKDILSFKDPHELSIALVEEDHFSDSKNIIGFHGVELLSSQPKETLNVLTDEMGLVLKKSLNDFFQLEMSGQEKHQVFIRAEAQKRGRLGIGTVHHIAWSVPDMESLSRWKTLFEKKQCVSDIENRKYFNSLYTRDPGRIIYEFATEGPGFQVDERFEELGKHLMLPKHFEADRKTIEANLPSLDE